MARSQQPPEVPEESTAAASQSTAPDSGGDMPLDPVAPKKARESEPYDPPQWTRRSRRR
jgi:hypothetical protein